MIVLIYASDYRLYDFIAKKTRDTSLPEFSFYLPNLEHLTLRAAVILHLPDNKVAQYSLSWLPAAAVFINLFGPSLRHLVLDIRIDLLPLNDLSSVDFSPLKVLGTACRSIPRIDLYVHTKGSLSALTRVRLLGELEKYKDIMESIEGGVLIHAEESAPESI